MKVVVRVLFVIILSALIVNMVNIFNTLGVLDLCVLTLIVIANVWFVNALTYNLLKLINICNDILVYNTMSDILGEELAEKHFERYSKIKK